MDIVFWAAPDSCGPSDVHNNGFSWDGSNAPSGTKVYQNRRHPFYAQNTKRALRSGGGIAHGGCTIVMGGYYTEV